MKKERYLPILLMVWPYLGLVLFRMLVSGKSMLGRQESSAFLSYAALTAVVYVVNVIYAFRYKEEEAEAQLVFWDMAIKLVHIPFYLIMFAVGLVFLLAMVVPALLMISPFILMILFIIDLFLMLTSSSYGISAVIRARQKGRISSGTAACYIVLHLFFVLDMVSAVLIYLKLKKKQ